MKKNFEIVPVCFLFFATTIFTFAKKTFGFPMQKLSVRRNPHEINHWQIYTPCQRAAQHRVFVAGFALAVRYAGERALPGGGVHTAQRVGTP